MNFYGNRTMSLSESSPTMTLSKLDAAWVKNVSFFKMLTFYQHFQRIRTIVSSSLETSPDATIRRRNPAKNQSGDCQKYTRSSWQEQVAAASRPTTGLNGPHCSCILPIQAPSICLLDRPAFRDASRQMMVVL